MEVYEYKPNGVCAIKIVYNIENNIVNDIKVIGGCPGNSLGVRSLTQNQNIDYIIDKLSGIKCGGKNTSCPDQIAKGLIEYKQKRDLK